MGDADIPDTDNLMDMLIRINGALRHTENASPGFIWMLNEMDDLVGLMQDEITRMNRPEPAVPDIVAKLARIAERKSGADGDEDAALDEPAVARITTGPIAD
jgi:hypothetical protein